MSTYNSGQHAQASPSTLAAHTPLHAYGERTSTANPSFANGTCCVFVDIPRWGPRPHGPKSRIKAIINYSHTYCTYGKQPLRRCMTHPAPNDPCRAWRRCSFPPDIQPFPDRNRSTRGAVIMHDGLHVCSASRRIISCISLSHVASYMYRTSFSSLPADNVSSWTHYRGPEDGPTDRTVDVAPRTSEKAPSRLPNMSRLPDFGCRGLPPKY
jgi:hypothetical protein